MLADAQNLTTLFLYPWLLVPGIFVIIAVLAFNSSVTACAPPPTPTSSRRPHPPRWARGCSGRRRYIARCGAEAGHFVTFDRRPGRWQDKLFHRRSSHDGAEIHMRGYAGYVARRPHHCSGGAPGIRWKRVDAFDVEIRYDAASDADLAWRAYMRRRQ